MPATTTCPFCNALVKLPESVPASGRIPCPRCGETFALKGQVSARGSELGPPATGVTTGSGAGLDRTGQRTTSRMVWAALGLGLVAVCVILAVNLLGDPPSPIAPEAKEVAGDRTPAELPGLGYLPPQTEGILALDVARVAQTAEQTPPGGPRELMLGAGFPEGVVGWIENNTGIALANLDSVVAGFRTDQRAIPPQFVLVVQTREPYSIDELAERLKARPFRKGDRKLYEVHRGLPFFVWPTGDRTLLFAMSPQDFDDVPRQPAAGVAHLPEPIRDLIRTRVAADAAFWTVARSDGWAEVAAPLFLLGPLRGRPGIVAAARDLRSLVLSVRIGTEPSLSAHVEFKTEEVGEAWRSDLAQRFRKDKGVVNAGGEAAWLTLDTPMTPPDLQRFGERLLGALGKKK